MSCTPDSPRLPFSFNLVQPGGDADRGPSAGAAPVEWADRDACAVVAGGRDTVGGDCVRILTSSAEVPRELQRFQRGCAVIGLANARKLLLTGLLWHLYLLELLGCLQPQHSTCFKTRLLCTGSIELNLQTLNSSAATVASHKVRDCEQTFLRLS